MLCFVSQVRLFNGGPDAYVMILISVLPLQACFDYLLLGMPTPLPVELSVLLNLLGGSVDSLSATELSVLLKLLGVSGTFCPSESPWCQRRFSLCYRGGQPLFLWNFLSSRISLMAASILSPTGTIGPSLGLGWSNGQFARRSTLSSSDSWQLASDVSAGEVGEHTGATAGRGGYPQ